MSFTSFEASMFVLGSGFYSLSLSAHLSFGFSRGRILANFQSSLPLTRRAEIAATRSPRLPLSPPRFSEGLLSVHGRAIFFLPLSSVSRCGLGSQSHRRVDICRTRSPPAEISWLFSLFRIDPQCPVSSVQAGHELARRSLVEVRFPTGLCPFPLRSPGMGPARAF